MKGNMTINYKQTNRPLMILPSIILPSQIFRSPRKLFGVELFLPNDFATHDLASHPFVPFVSFCKSVLISVHPWLNIWLRLHLRYVHQ